ncbi:MAG: tetratricopeptide repeat protein [Gammaproteobacteria bacterium]|nr:tetratricopeptide repeat protein [Gammaproteobacteria bacterium]
MGKKNGFKQKKGNTRPVSLQFTAPMITPKVVSQSLDVVTAGGYLHQAMQALQNSQWQEVCRITQLCIAGTHDRPEYHHSAKGIYAAALMKLFDYEQALEQWKDIEVWNPADVANLGNIGVVLIQLQRYAEAIEYFQRILRVQPDNVSAHLGLGLAASNNYDFAQAITSYRQALTYNPQSVEMMLFLAGAIRDQGFTFQDDSQIESAYQAYENVLKQEPRSFSATSSMLLMWHNRYPLSMDAYQHDLQRCCEFFKQTTVVEQRSCRLHIPLRIGFVSGDLRVHPVGYFLESTLAQINHDPALNQQVSLIAYHTNSKQDRTTQQLKSLFDMWYQVHSWSDEELIKQIQKDEIDILIDLSGHTDDNRLAVFAHKPAPIQVSWLGYWGSTGLSNIDYVLADPISVPVDEEKWFVEKIWRLPSLRYCFSPPKDAPEVSNPPCLSRGYVTFACYQNVRKINQGVLRCWSEILLACPQARLRIQAKEFVDHKTQVRFVERLCQVGIDIQRVTLVAGMDRRDYLASYADVDILLDTFPYPGGTTTAEALWMGVPTLTLSMVGMLGRQGEALLINAGLSDWVAHREDEYVQKAIAWGNLDVSQYSVLSQLREGMRAKVKQTPVFDEKQFAQDFVAAMLAMWQKSVKARCKNDGNSIHLN